MATSPPAKKIKVISASNISSPEKLNKLFTSLVVLIIEQGIGKTRSNILQKQVTKHGGEIEKTLSCKVTHIVISKTLKKDQLLKVLKVKSLNESIEILNVDWLSECLVKGVIADSMLYKVYTDDSKTVRDESQTKDIPSENKIEAVKAQDEDVSTSHTSLQQLMELKYKLVDSEDEDTVDSNYDQIHHKIGDTRKDAIATPTSASSSKQSGLWACATPSSTVSKHVNHNQSITDKLEILEKSYTTTQDRWRAVGYKKAIGSIKKYHKPLQSYNEILSLPFVGERLAKKIWEIVETGHLRRLDFIDPKVELLETFSKVWGAGPKTAEHWVAQGYKSLDDLKNLADLNFQQKIGLQYYDDINERMPRDEAAEIEKAIRDVAVELLPDVLLVVCGSYRRGRATCGDIDILISHPDNRSHYGFLITLLDRLKERKLITNDLITVQKDEQRKYMGLIKLPGDNRKQRRIDFIVAPYEEWACALMHFTGSAHFNRSIRLLAKKKNMSLSEHALRDNVVRSSIKGEEKLNKGSFVHVTTEKDIFDHFGLDYLQPTDRDW